MTTPPKDTSGEKPLRVRRGRVDSVDLYEIKDNELDLLEKGSPVNVYLNFSIFLFSLGFAALGTLCTAEKFKYELAQTFYVVIVVVGFLLGAFLLIIWYQRRSSISSVTEGIRSRIPPEENISFSAQTLPKAPEKKEEQLETEPRDKGNWGT